MEGLRGSLETVPMGFPSDPTEGESLIGSRTVGTRKSSPTIHLRVDRGVPETHFLTSPGCRGSERTCGVRGGRPRR